MGPTANVTADVIDQVRGPWDADIAVVLSHRHDNGADYWATPDGNLLKGSPFTTLYSALLLAELGVPASDPVLAATTGLIWAAQREDGRFGLRPRSAIYPCHSAHAAQVLCRLGYAADPRMAVTFTHLLDSQHPDGGWRCNRFPYGRGPETECSNPHPTLMALDAFRHTGHHDDDPRLDRAVEFLLGHWTTRAPIGPCHYGIGSLFRQVEYPFRSYNLFFWVHVLSHYRSARTDPRFLEAFAVLQAKLVDGRVVVERAVPALARLDFCRKGQPSTAATARYREIVTNLGPAPTSESSAMVATGSLAKLHRGEGAS